MSRSPHLTLPNHLYRDMLAHAQSELPNECCGLLAGVFIPDAETLWVAKRYPLINEAASPVEYRSEPRSRFLADKDMRLLGYEMLAIYHSHPRSAPIPSRTDLERNYSGDILHFIISLQGAEPVMRGWRLFETSYEEAVWHLVES